MKHLLLALLAALALPTSVEANIDPKVHKICKDAKDYMGCAQANKKEISIFDGLSKKETEFLKAYIKSPKRVSTSNGKWILQGINERSGDETYIDINSIKPSGLFNSNDNYNKIAEKEIKSSMNYKYIPNIGNDIDNNYAVELFENGNLKLIKNI